MDLAQGTNPTPLDPKHLGTFLWAMVILILATGVLVMVFRLLIEGRATTPQNDRPADRTLIRSWLAIALVSGLLLFAVGSLFIDDPSLWNLLMGGIIASAGTATAFYFASKAAEQTQQNLLNAAFGGAGPTIELPDVKGHTVANSRKILEALRLKLAVPDGSTDDQIVTKTEPTPGTVTKAGDTVTATVEAPPTQPPTGQPQPFALPDITGKTVAEARTTIEVLKLVFATEPADAGPDRTVASTKPPPSTPVKTGDTVTATVD